ncbi:MAG: hypothetical protein FWF59_06675 [Turicibacter sp.]|nr:hypothetical protein [Turicibacter sp.]
MPPIHQRFFACAHTFAGFHQFFKDNLEGFDHVYLLKTGPGPQNSQLIHRLGMYFSKSGYEVGWLCSTTQPDVLDGFLLPSLKAAVLIASGPSALEPAAPGAIEHYVNLGAAWDTKKLHRQKDVILSLNEKLNEAFDGLYDHFEKASITQDDWEKILEKNLDLEKGTALVDLLGEAILNYPSIGKDAKVAHRFASAYTAIGFVDYSLELSAPSSKRYFIRGSWATGNSNLLKAFLERASHLGYDAQAYHCPLDPDQLAMVLIPQLGVAFLVTEDLPEKEGDQLIDTDKFFFKSGKHGKKQDPLPHCLEMEKTRRVWEEILTLQGQLNDIYSKATNPDVVDGFYEYLRDQLDELRDKAEH